MRCWRYAAPYTARASAAGSRYTSSTRSRRFRIQYSGIPALAYRLPLTVTVGLQRGFGHLHHQQRAGRVLCKVIARAARHNGKVGERLVVVAQCEAAVECADRIRLLALRAGQNRRGCSRSGGLQNLSQRFVQQANRSVRSGLTASLCVNSPARSSNRSSRGNTHASISASNSARVIQRRIGRLGRRRTFGLPITRLTAQLYRSLGNPHARMRVY
jgi:hypothetical protein